MWLVPPSRLTLDIETIAGDPSEAEDALRRSFAADPRWKPITIGERYLAALEVKKERLALLDTAPILSVALRTESDCRLLHWMDFDDRDVAGVPLERVNDERALLIRTREYLDSISPQTLIIGHNLRHFDLRKLRLAMLRYGLRLPTCLGCEDHPTYDTMQMWRYFSLEDKPFVSLSECLESSGLTSHKRAVTGADVPALFEKREFRTIAAYAIADVLAQEALYLRMTGQDGDQPGCAAGEDRLKVVSKDQVAELLEEFLP